MTSVLIAAQYASGKRNSRATSREITAAIAVRTAWTKIGLHGDAIHANRPFDIFSLCTMGVTLAYFARRFAVRTLAAGDGHERDSSTQSNDLVTARFHMRYISSRSPASMTGFQVWSTAQLARRSRKSAK